MQKNTIERGFKVLQSGRWLLASVTLSFSQSPQFTNSRRYCCFPISPTAMASSKPYPTPFVVPPHRSDQHTHTIILLYGRGSNGEQFGSSFLESTNIARRLPTVKFIFPTANKRRSKVLKRIPINQWFENHSLDDPNTRTELHIDGLEETN